MNLEIFENKELGVSIRSEMIDGEPWFIAKDVCDALGYSDTQAMTRRLDPEDVKSYTDHTSGQGRTIKIINESGLYTSILGSRKTESKVFKKWVTSEVLPSIRKTGSYSTKEVTTLEIIEMARDSELKRLETQRKLEVQKVVNVMLEEKIDRKDNIILAVARLNIQAGDILLQEFAKNLNIKNLGRTNIFAWFKERGYLMKNTEPYSQYMKRGFFTRKPTEEKFGGKIRYTTMITPKGQTYFTQILRAEFEPEITPEEF